MKLMRLALGLVLLAPMRQAAAQEDASCGADSVYQALDFWVGRWEVYVGENLAGSNEVLKVLDGCAVEERWRAADGSEGRSLFYVEPLTRRWKQVWVTGRARVPGGLKEKRWLPVGGGAVRFQGEIGLADGGLLLDRTTLTPMAGGQVRQLIEVSRDGGNAWRPVFDATYRRQTP